MSLLYRLPVTLAWKGKQNQLDGLYFHNKITQWPSIIHTNRPSYTPSQLITPTRRLPRRDHQIDGITTSVLAGNRSQTTSDGDASAGLPVWPCRRTRLLGLRFLLNWKLNKSWRDRYIYKPRRHKSMSIFKKTSTTPNEWIFIILIVLVWKNTLNWYITCHGYIRIHHSPFIGPIKITPWNSWNEMYLFPS